MPAEREKGTIIPEAYDERLVVPEEYHQEIVGPHIVMLGERREEGGYVNEKFLVHTGIGDIPEDELKQLTEVAGKRTGMCPVQLTIFPEAVQNLAEAIVNDAYSERATQLVAALGLYSHGDVISYGSHIRERVLAGMRIRIPELGNRSLLELFDGNTLACQCALITGIFQSLKPSIESNQQKFFETQNLFTSVMNRFGINQQDYFLYIQAFDKAAELLWWLNPSSSNASLFGDIQRAMANRTVQAHYQESLTELGVLLQDPKMLEMSQHLLPAGELRNKVGAAQKTGVVLHEDRERIIALLQNDASFYLQAISYIMSANSQREITSAIRSLLHHPLDQIPTVLRAQPFPEEDV